MGIVTGPQSKLRRVLNEITGGLIANSLDWTARSVRRQGLCKWETANVTVEFPGIPRSLVVLPLPTEENSPKMYLKRHEDARDKNDEW